MSEKPFDDYVARDGRAYAHALVNLLPRGVIWAAEAGSRLFKVLWGLGDFVARFDARAGTFLKKESFPGTAEETIADWERVAGLPDPCTGPITDLAERQRAVVARFAARGGASIPYFIGVAEKLGWHLVIEEFSPAKGGISRGGWTDSRFSAAPSRVFPRAMVPSSRFVWRIPIGPRGHPVYARGGTARGGDKQMTMVGMPSPSRLKYARGGTARGGDKQLVIDRVLPLECMLKKNAPEHTKVVFDYREHDWEFGYDVADVLTDRWSYEIHPAP